jgi:mevalonate kinase
MNRHHELQAALGTSDPTLEHLVAQFRSMSGILGAKISGSGLGDSVLALGQAEPGSVSTDLTPVTLTTQGVNLHHERN